MSFVKICGIRTLEEAQAAAHAGAWAIGEVFATSRRSIEVDQAAAINRKLNSKMLKIGVFVNEQLETIQSIIKNCCLDMVQLHGDEPPELLQEIPVPSIKSFSVKGSIDADFVKRWRPFAYLFDTAVNGQYGGSGKAFDWEHLEPVKHWPNIILAGGLTAENVCIALQYIKPLALDVSSGVEFSEGGKDPAKIKAFINTVKNC